MEGQAERDLEQALGAEEVRELDLNSGARIGIRSLRLGQLGGFSRAIKPIWHDAGAVAAEAGEGEGEAVSEGMSGILQRMVMEHSDSLIDAIAAATPLSREEAEQLDIEDTLRVAEAVIAVNADFFTRRVLPAMKSLIQSQREQIIAARAASGSTSSSG